MEVQEATECANLELRGAVGPEIQTFVCAGAGVGDCPGREERSWLRQKLAPATLSSLAGKGEPAKGGWLGKAAGLDIQKDPNLLKTVSLLCKKKYLLFVMIVKSVDQF